MSALMRLSIKEQKDILKNLRAKRSKKFNKEYSKLLRIIEEHSFLKSYEDKLKKLKDDFKSELNSINTDDVGWERHESKGAEIEKNFNKKLFDIKYEINSILNSFNELKTEYYQYEKLYEEVIKSFEQDEKAKNLISEIEKVEFPKFSNSSEFKKLKEKIKESIEKIEDIKKRSKIISSYELNFRENKFVFMDETDEILNKIKSLDKEEYERIKALETDEKLKVKEAKVIYQRLIYSKIYKDEIETLLEEVPEYLKEKFEKLQEKKIIYKNEYEKLLDEYYNQEDKSISVDKIVEAFEEVGYRFEEVVLNEKGYIDTDKEDYKIAYRIDDDKLSLAFTRFVDKNNSNINEYEREKDKQMAKKWCSNFEKISDYLKKQGIELNKDMVKEADEVEIRYETVESKESKATKQYSKTMNF